MKVYKESYKNSNGKTTTKQKWYIDFYDHFNRRHRLAGFVQKKPTEELARQIESLISYRISGQSLPVELQRWIESLPDSLLKKLVSWCLIDSQRAEASKPLHRHLEDWETALQASGTAKNAEMKYSRVKRVFDACQFKSLSDVSASKVQFKITGLKKTVRRENNGSVRNIETDILLSQRSQHHILSACKQFCKWAKADGRTSNNPLEHLKPVKVTETQDRAAFSTDEISYLLTVTEAAPERCNMTGNERALLYRLAVQTGLRADELRSLTKDCFNFNNLTVTLSGQYTKNGQEAELPLRADTALLLEDYLACKLPTAKAFNMPVDTARMLYIDMEKARQKWIEKHPELADNSDFLTVENSQGKRDFHALRHTFATMLAATGTHPKTAQTLLRHSKVDLTMSIYTHSLRDKETTAINQLPDLTAPEEIMEQLATGTDPKNADFSADRSAAKYCQNMPEFAKIQEVLSDNTQTIKNPVSESKSAILSQKQGSFSKPPERLELSTVGLQNRSSTN